MGDLALAEAVVLGKVAATLPSKSQQHLLHAVSHVRRSEERYAALPDMRLIREGCWREEALTIRYTDKAGALTERDIWPLAIAYLKNIPTVLAWCWLREGLRMFRADRIIAVKATGVSFRPKRVALLRRYLAELTAPERTSANGSFDCVRPSA